MISKLHLILITLTAGIGIIAPAVAQSTGESNRTTTPVSNQQDLRKPLTAAETFKALALTSKAFRAASAKVRGSLVTIESRGGVSARQGRIGGIRKRGEGNTTGVMISSDGYVVTSTFNFIDEPPIITVITGDGERRVAKPLGRDDTRKLCLLKIQDVQDMPTPEFLDPDEITVGQWAISVGVGYGDSNPAISMGIISATNRIGGRAIQTDANISPANYGGPLVDLQGRVIGICVPLNPSSQATGAGVEWYDSGIGFAVSLFDADEWLERLKKGERILPAFLGVRVVPNPDGDGLRIEEVVKDSPAMEAGLKQADIITSINAEPIGDMMRLRQVLNRFESGQTIEVRFLADEDEEKKEQTISLKLTRPPRPKNQPNPLEPPKIR